MTYMLPIIDELAACVTDAERAEWLLRAPDGIIVRDVESIRAVLLVAGFRFGADALDVRYAALYATRTKGGDLPASTRENLEIHRSGLRAIAQEQGDSIGETH